MQQVSGNHQRVSHCRSCGSTNFSSILNLGDMPLANALVTKQQETEKVYPLELTFCRDCSLAQLSVSIPPTEIFDEYLYFSSYSETMLEHSRKNVERLIQTYSLTRADLFVEIASNDGYLLQYVVQNHIPALGIEPARNVAEIARQKGITTVVEYFGKELAERLVSEQRQAKVIVANNVMAHVPDLHSFIEGIRILLQPNGVAVIESPYLKPLLDDCKFDTIYHEHLFYYSLTAVKHLIEQHGLEIVNVEHLNIHGGSLRMFIQHAGLTPPSRSVAHLLREEINWVFNEAYYHTFAKNVFRVKDVIRDVLYGFQAQGKRIAAYGAAAKGTIFSNVFGLDSSLIDFVIDKNPHKQNHLMPGVHIPIYGVEHLLAEMPEYLLIFIWNFAREVMRQQAEYQKRGGQFIVSIPHIRISAISDLHEMY